MENVTSSMSQLLTRWNKATENLKWGVQRVFYDVFALAAEGKTHLIYGRDYYQGMPCLVNTVGGMLTTGGGHGIPSEHFGEVVSLFDEINREFANQGINTEPHRVSEVAAEVLLRYFGNMKDEPKNVLEFDGGKTPWMEPTDEQMAEAMVALFSADSTATKDVVDIIVNDTDEIAVGKIDVRRYEDNF